MDSTIRSLLGKSEQKNSKEFLLEAYSKLKGGRTKTSDQTDPFQSDLYVLCGEVALKLEEFDIVNSCMKLFFQKTPPTNQFLCRAYLCQARLNAPASIDEKEKLHLSISYLMKAINFAKSNSRYYFLVYNASVLYWAFARPFMRPNYRQQLIKSFHLVVKALDETNDPDFEWRARLMIAVMECHIDCGKRDDALHVGQAAMSFMKANIPHKCKEVFLLQLQHKLLEPPKIQTIVKYSPELSLVQRMYKINSQVENLSTVQVNELERIYKCIVDGEDISDERRSGSSSSRSHLPFTLVEKSSLLLDLARLCCKTNEIDLACQCVSSLNGLPNVDERFACEVGFLQCQLKVDSLKDKKEGYSKLAIETRIDAIETLSEHLMSAHRMNAQTSVQVGCVTMWNLCLPILQNNLRGKIHKHLLLAAELLEEIDSLLMLLRCQLHTEVAKCEEEVNQLQSAITHLLKGAALDDSGSYKTRLTNSINRIKLKALLYQVPERPEDHAAMIIEQAECQKDSTSCSKMQVYLSRAGSLLAPDSFMLAMDGETQFNAVHPIQCTVEMFAKRVKAYQNGSAKIEGHLKRLEGTDDAERIRLWSDLVKVARKQSVWDVTRVASRFCLLYEAARSTSKLSIPDSSTCKSPVVGGGGGGSKASPINAPLSEMGVISKEELTGMTPFSEYDDITRIFADINFIFGESLVQLLHKEGIQLLEKAVAPKDTKLRPKKYQNNPINVSEMVEWRAYSDWIDQIAQEAFNRFHTAGRHGDALNDSMIVCNAAIYTWNYTKHLLERKEYSQLTQYYQPLFNLLRRTGHGTETVFLCDLTNALAQGYMRSHIPSSYFNPTPKVRMTPISLTPQLQGRRKSGKSSQQNLGNKAKGGTASVLNTDTLYELQQAADILDYTLNITAGADRKNMVPIAVRHKLIKAQVLCKALMNQNLPKNFGHDNDSVQSQGPMCKALFILEALTLKNSRITDFSLCPGIKDVIQRVENAKWTDNLIQLQVWSRLASLAFDSSDHTTSLGCCDAALRLENKSGKSQKQTTEKAKHRFLVEEEMLYYASVIKGQCIVATMNGRNELKRKGLDCFVQACRYASECNSYDLVLSAARHYWNNICASICTPIERQLLQQPIRSLLTYINKVSKNVFEEDDEKPGHQKKQPQTARGKTKPTNQQTENQKASDVDPSSMDNKQKSQGEDLSLRAALYGVLFQTFADKGEFEAGLSAMDEAIRVMPRTHHRLLLFKHRVITSAKLNKPIQFDMGKFRDENESLLAQMWYRIAKNSKSKAHQLSAFINAIEALTEEENVYQKVDYLADFGEWLLVNEHPIKKARDQLLYAIYLVLNGMSGGNMPTDGGQYMTDEEELNLLNHVKDVKQMDTLVRLYVMIGEMRQKKDEKYREDILSAATLIQRIWKVSITNVEKSIMAGIHPGELSPAKTKKPPKVRPPSKTTGYLPTTVEAWAQFKLPEKLREYFKLDPNGSFISKVSIEKPMLSMFFYEKLCDNLYEIGLHHLAVRVLALMFHLSNDVLMMPSLSTLVNMKMADLCERLNLVNASKFYQEVLADVQLTEEEQAKSREQVEFWQEKQRQVTLEEHHQSRHGTSNFVKSFHSLDTIQQLKPVIGDLTLRKVWVKMAEYLIRTYQFQTARMFLEEATISAEAFDDAETKELIMYNYALISYHLRDWGKVVSIISNMMCAPDSQMFWLKKILLLVDALHNFSKQDTSFQHHINDTGFEKAKTVLENAIETISAACQKRKNAAYLGPYIKARLLSRLGLIVYTESMERRYRAVEVRKKLLEKACGYLKESFTLLSEFGYEKDSIEMMFLRVEIQRQIALLQNDTEAKKASLIQTLEMAKSAARNVSLIADEITKMSTYHEMGNIFLPIQNDIVTARKHCIGILYEIIAVASEERKVHRLKEESKAPIERLIDEYVDAGPNLSTAEQAWNSAIFTATEEAMAMVTSTKSLSSSVPTLSAEASLSIGVFIGLLSHFNCAGRFDSWNAVSASSKDNTTDTTQVDSVKQTSETNIPEESLVEFENFKSFQLQAVHSLTQALQIALQHSLTTVVRDASYHLLDCVGTFDIYTSVQLLALYQSAHASLRCQDILERALIDPSTSASASLYKQRLCFQQNVSLRNHTDTIDNCLSEFEWWRRLSVSKGHFDIVKEVPFNIAYVILQHSPKKDYLYAGVLEKTQVATAGKKKAASRVTIGRVSTNQKVLNDLLELLNEFGASVRSEFIRQIYVDSLKEQRHDLMASKASDTTMESEALQADLDLCNVETEKIKELFDSLMTALEAYMGPLLHKIHEALLLDPIPQTVVILADDDLLEFPLEFLSVFKKSEFTSLTRDFSLQFFYHRFRRGQTDSGSQSKMEHKSLPAKTKPEKSGKGEKGSGGGKKLPEKKVMKDFVVDKENIQLDLSNLKYILDPLKDEEKDPDHPDLVLEELLTQYKNKVSKWSGIKGSEEISNVKEMQIILQSSPALLFHGFERLLSILPAFSVVPLDLSDCVFALLLDRVHTSNSNLRQGKLDAQKSPSDLQLESKVHTAMILSLCGVSTIALNQWYTKLKNNKHRVKEIFSGLYDGSLTIGQCVRSMHGLPKPIFVNEEENEKGREGKQGGKKRNSNSVNSKKPPAGTRAESVAKGNAARADSAQSSGSGGRFESEMSEEEQMPVKCFYENFNLVVYGLPNFAST